MAVGFQSTKITEVLSLRTRTHFLLSDKVCGPKYPKEKALLSNEGVVCHMLGAQYMFLNECQLSEWAFQSSPNVLRGLPIGSVTLIHLVGGSVPRFPLA